ncbi:MAG: S-layer family protein [Planctomycetes bacterium]|nr:S-layer family protein [Planctomycetota bacterium]
MFASVGEVGVGGGAPVVNNLEHLGEINITHSFERKEIGDHKVGNLDVSGNGGGTVYIRGGKFVMEGGQVSSETSGDKSAGGIDIRLSGDFVGKDQSKILSETSGSGDTGNIYIEAENITLETDSEICNAATRFESSGKLGDIAIRADGLVTISGDSVVEIDNRGSGKVGDITIKADKLVTISDDSVVEIDNRSSGTGGNIVAVGGDLTLATGGEIRTSARSRINDSGNASNITITAGSVSMSDFSRIENFFFSRGEAGAITLNVDNLTMTRNSEILSDVFAFSGATKAGDITITTEGSVIMSENSFILSRIDSNELPGFGVGGNITIGAEKKVHLFQNSIISVDAFDAARAGNVSIRAGNSCLFENSSLTTNAESASETITAGNIRVETNSLSLVGSKSKISSSIEGIGEAGSIELVDVEKLALLRGAVINTDSIGNGKAGDITVVSKDISIAGSGSAISSSAEGKGDSGAIVLNNAETLMVLEGGIITTDSKGAGKAGGITVASNKILLSGSASAISSSTEGSGNSGSIELNTLGSVILSEGGVISTNSTGEGRGGDIIVTSGNVSLSGSDSAISSTSEGIKDAGSITINADNLLMNGNSAITTDAKRANGGSINLTFHSLMHLVDSEITSSVKGGTSTEGGKISMNLNRGVLESSQIRATAIEGKGGNIDIRAEVFLADPNSVVSASSEKGIDGEVDIRAPITNISGNIVPLKSNFSSATSLLLQPCAVKMSGGKRSSLVIVSRDGLPMQPGDLLPSPLYDEAMAAVDAEMASMNVGPTLVYGANTIQKKGLLPLELLGDESGCATCP